MGSVDPKQKPRQPTFQPGWPALAPALLIAALGVALWPTRFQPSVGPVWLLPAVNAVYTTAVAAAVSVLAGRTVAAGAPQGVVFLGGGMLAYAAASLLGGVCATTGHLNEGIAIFNIGVALAGASNLMGALLLFLRPDRQGYAIRPSVALVYSAIAAAIGAVTWAAFAGVFPPLLIPGKGPTALRSAILGISIAEFACSSAFLFFSSSSEGPRFLRLYASGLGLIAFGFAAVVTIRYTGNPLGWAGTLSMYSGVAYLMAAVIHAVRRSRRWFIPLTMLKETYGRYTSLVDTSPDSVLVLARDTCLFANPAGARLFGASHPRELAGRPTLDRVHPDDRPSFQAWITTAATEAPHPWQGRIQRPDASSAYVEAVRAAVEFDGRPAVQVLLRDITERKEAERALRASETRWATTLASIGDAVIAIDTQGRITFLNRVAQELVGWTSDEAEGRLVGDVLRIVNEQTRERAPDPVGKASQSGLIAGLANHSVLIRRDGSELPIDDSRAPIQTDDGTTLGVVLVFRDIRESRRAEDALREAKDRAEQATRAKSEFLAHMSHEIRTPLSAIIGLTEVMQPRLATEEKREFIGLIRESAQSLLAIIGDVLDLSRIEAGRVEVLQSEFSLTELLESAVASSQLKAKEKSLELDLSMDESLPRRMIGDSGLIGQVLRNLLSNAVKYTQRGSIHVRARRGNDGGLHIEVADTGLGVPASRQALLFESFARLHVDSSAQAGTEGTGLGLAISRKLVELMGGEIGVQSAEGVGSTFWLTLPMPAGVREPGGPPAAPGGATDRHLSALPPLRVLIVEDNRINRLFLRTAFADGGHHITTAEDGAQALEAVRREVFDLVLMDVQLPVMDGVAATREIRRLDAQAGRVPIIALTAFAIKGDEARFLAAGMDGYVAKPVDFQRLAVEIRRVRGRPADLLRAGDPPR